MTRFAILLTGYCALAALVVPAFVRPAPRLIWNASASVPVGLYAARPPHHISRGDLVAALPPPPLARLMAERHYLPVRVPMLKHVGAISGQTICRHGETIYIDTKPVAVARRADRAGRELPAWIGCRTVQEGEVFLLNPTSPDSFDGRYFGTIPTRAVSAILTSLWLPDARPEAASPARLRNSHSKKGPQNDQDR